MEKNYYKTNQATTLNLNLPLKIKVGCRDKPKIVETYHKRVYSIIDDPVVEIVVPVLNEEQALERNIKTLYQFLEKQNGLRFKITIADNGSTDKTATIAEKLAKNYTRIQVVRLVEKGRGRALKQAWMNSNADILSYMDIDLSTSLDDFIPMIKPLIYGDAGVAIGSRLDKKSKTTRGFKRDFISKTYNKIIKMLMRTKFSDAQCGFKAIRKDVSEELLPEVSDTQWFFDTELLVKAEKFGIPIHEQPVSWVEDTDSRVKIVKTVVEDLKGLLRVKKELKLRKNNPDINLNNNAEINKTQDKLQENELTNLENVSKIGKTQIDVDNRQPTKRTTPIIQKFIVGFLLLVTGVTYLYGAAQNGMGNSYYAAAVQAATKNFTAWLFGSLDAANFVSVDKPPLATMMMGLSARIFGFSNFSMMLPSVLAGVGTVYLVYRIIKRYFGFKSGMIAGVVLAITPVVALMSGFNNPDAILMFFLTVSGYYFIKALEKHPLKNLTFSALFSGLAFNTKMLQGLMILPAIYVVYICFAKPNLKKRILHLCFFTILVMICSLSWTFLVYFTPETMRPWVGSTNDNNIWSLIFGYNGFGRLLGNSPGNGGGGGGRSGFGGETGIFRMFNSEFGPNIAWFIPLAIISAITVLIKLRNKERSNIQFSITSFWLIWLLIHVFIFSMTSGTIHPYYVVVLAPAVAALVGIGLPIIIKYYTSSQNIWLFPITVMVTSLTAAVILSTSGNELLMWVVLALGVASSLALFLNKTVTINLSLAKLSYLVTIIAILITPIYYTVATVSQSHVGSIPTAGPNSTALIGSNNENAKAEQILVKFLIENNVDTTWVAATNSANESAAIQISTGKPVMALGGFNGSDPVLTLSKFKEYIASGKIKYYVMNKHGIGGGPGGSNEVVSWIKQTCSVVNYGGSEYTVYQLTA